MKTDLFIYAKDSHGWTTFVSPDYIEDTQILYLAPLTEMPSDPTVEVNVNSVANSIVNSLDSDSDIDVRVLSDQLWKDTFIFICSQEYNLCTLLRWARISEEKKDEAESYGIMMRDAENRPNWTLEGVCSDYSSKDEFMMYIPVELKTQLHAKAIVSFVVSGSGMIIYIIAFNWYCLLTYGWVDDPIITFLMPFLHMLIALVSVIFASYFGLFMDTINPKLVWDDEINALRGNYNVFINTAVVLAAVGGVCVISLVLDWLINSGTALAVAILLITVLALMGMQVCLKKGEKNLMSIE